MKIMSIILSCTALLLAAGCKAENPEFNVTIENTVQELDLDRYLARISSNIFMVRAKSEPVTGAGLLDGDILIVSRSIGPRRCMIVAASVNGEVCVRR